MLRLKEGVKLTGISPEMVLGATIVDQCYMRVLHESGYAECWITSGTDGQHMANSLHYAGKALDFRTRDVVASQLPQLVEAIKSALGPEFDVVLEGDHLHVEHDPD